MTISKATTYITAPLRKDGYVDYAAALNQRCSQGVTPENNMVVLFVRAVGPESIKKRYREKYFHLLGIPPLPEKGDYPVSLEKYAKGIKDIWIPKVGPKDGLSILIDPEPDEATALVQKGISGNGRLAGSQ